MKNKNQIGIGKGIKILVIDDDAGSTRPLVKNLKDYYSFDITWLQEADKVLETLSHTYQAIILDMVMPIPENWSERDKRDAQNGQMTGAVLLNKIRQEHPLIPIIIYSAKDFFIQDKRSCLIRKPEENDYIVEKILKFIEKK